MASPVNQEDLVKQFQEVTGVDPERARFYLEASNWQLPVAMGGFFEAGDVEDPSNAIEDSDPEDSRLNTTNVPTATALPQQPPRATNVPRSGLMTMDALRNLQGSDGDSSDEDSNKQAFYAGGSESSGQQVLGPRQGPPKNRDELIAEMFKKAREAGAEEMEPPQMLKKKGAGGPSTFGGVGYKLGETETEPSVVVGGPSTSSSSTAATPAVRDVVLRLWSQGFTVDDGPLRSYKDPANAAFLESIKRSEVPRELTKAFPGEEVGLTMQDRRAEDYAPPKPVVRPFAGKGQMLGSPAPSITSAAVSTTEGDRKANEVTARGQIGLVPGEPTTNIQLRLADGSRLVAQFNPTHTVNDLHTFINTARPEFSSVNYVLTLFPSTELTEKTKSLKDANVLNSALVQKIKQ